MKIWALMLSLLAAAPSCGIAQAAVFTFDAAPEITFEVPQGWTACDVPTRIELLGPVPSGAMRQLCSGFDAKDGARMVGAPDGSLAMSFAINDASVFPPDYFQETTPQQLSESAPAMCRGLLNEAAVAADCAFRFETVADRRAVVGRVRAPSGEYEILRAVFVPGETRSVVFIFLTSRPGTPAAKQMDEIVASIRVSQPTPDSQATR